MTVTGWVGGCVRVQESGIIGASQKGMVALAGSIKSLYARMVALESAAAANAAAASAAAAAGSPSARGGPRFSGSSSLGNNGRERGPTPDGDDSGGGGGGARGRGLGAEDLERVEVLETMVKAEVSARMQGEKALLEAIKRAQQVGQGGQAFGSTTPLHSRYGGVCVGGCVPCRTHRCW